MVALVLHWDDWGDNTRHYEAITALVGLPDRLPDGLLVHTSGHTPDGGFRTFDVWESREHIERFIADELMPAVTQVAGQRPAVPVTEVYDLLRVLQA
jgi:hypothetical protein